MPQASPPQSGSGTNAAQTAAIQAAQATAVNAQLRAALLANSVEATQNIFSQTIANPSGPINIPFRNVGLIKGFIVRVDATIANSGSAVASLTELNAANLLSNVTLTDLDNYQRINTTGWHLEFMATDKEGFPTGSALVAAAFDDTVKYGNNFQVQVAPATIANGTSGTVRKFYWVPCSYSATDLRGAIYSGVVNAVGYLQLTPNPNPGAGAGDGTLAVYGGANTTMTITSMTVNVYQVYQDQLPRYDASAGQMAGQPILPPLDISTQYRLNTTALTGMAVGQDFPIPFSNFQQFLSLSLIYDQAGTLNGSPPDVNYFALQAANTYLPWKVDPYTAAWKSRHKIMTDWPAGCWVFEFRSSPISTNQTGNMELVMNAVSAAGGSIAMVGFEAFALVNNVLGAASLPAG